MSIFDCRPCLLRGWRPTIAVRISDSSRYNQDLITWPFPIRPVDFSSCSRFCRRGNNYTASAFPLRCWYNGKGNVLLETSYPTFSETPGFTGCDSNGCGGITPILAHDGKGTNKEKGNVPLETFSPISGISGFTGCDSNGCGGAKLILAHNLLCFPTGVCGKGAASAFPVRCWYNNDPQGRYVCCDSDGCDGFNPPGNFFPRCKSNGYVPPNL